MDRIMTEMTEARLRAASPKDTSRDEKHLLINNAIKDIESVIQRADQLLNKITNQAFIENTNQASIENKSVTNINDLSLVSFLDNAQQEITEKSERIDEILRDIHRALF